MADCLVTGGAGFIGSHLAAALCARGDRVTVFDDLSTGREANLRGLPVRLIRADVRDRAALAGAMAGHDLCFHLAALVLVAASMDDPLLCHDINVTGTCNVLAAAKAAGVTRVVLASSASVYGDDPSLPKMENMPPQPRSPYAASKWLNEIEGKVYADVFGLSVTALRLFNVYGPRQDESSPYSGVIARFAAACRAGRPLTIMGDGRQTRDFIYVGDIVQGILRAADRTGGFAVYNLGTGSETSLLDLQAVLAELTGLDIKPNFAPARPGDLRRSAADISLARRELGFTPAVPLRAGLAALLNVEDPGSISI